MRIDLDLKPDIESYLVEHANSLAVSIEVYIQQVLESSIDPSALTPLQEKKQRFEQWLKSHEYITAPPLSDEALNRESIYSEREEQQLWDSEPNEVVGIEYKVSEELQRMMAGKKTDEDTLFSQRSGSVIEMADWIDRRSHAEKHPSAGHRSKTAIDALANPHRQRRA